MQPSPSIPAWAALLNARLPAERASNIQIGFGAVGRAVIPWVKVL